jgi:hypothetical protein
MRWKLSVSRRRLLRLRPAEGRPVRQGVPVRRLESRNGGGLYNAGFAWNFLDDLDIDRQRAASKSHKRSRNNSVKDFNGRDFAGFNEPQRLKAANWRFLAACFRLGLKIEAIGAMAATLKTGNSPRDWLCRIWLVVAITTTGSHADEQQSRRPANL